MRGLLRALAGVVALLASAGVAAGGLLWEVRDARGELRGHLFGTVHLCDAGCYPLAPEVMQAFAGTQVLALELDPANPAMSGELARAGMLPAGAQLDQLLPDALSARLARAVALTGADGATLQRMQPWLASSALAVTAAAQAGFSAEQGVDLWLAEQARARGLPIVELEDVARQIRALSAGGLASQLESIGQVVDLILEARVSEFFGRMRLAWQQGEADQLLAMIYEGTDAERMAPLVDDLVHARNREMAGRIAELMGERRRVFVAIGAAHLGGASSVVAELRAHGFDGRQVR